MSTTTAGIQQLDGTTLDGESRVLAALATTADDLPDLDWQADEASSTKFSFVRVGQHDFALESEEVPEKQITVYGREAGEALDQLIQALGLTDDAVWDRIDRDHDSLGISVVETQAIAEFRQRTEEMLRDLDTRVEAIRNETQRSAERKLAAVALELGDLTDRERQVVSLLREGLEIEEVAEILQIRPDTVKRHWRSGIREVKSSGGGKGIMMKIPNAPKEEIVLPRKAGSRSKSGSTSRSGSRSSSRSRSRSRSGSS